MYTVDQSGFSTHPRRVQISPLAVESTSASDRSQRQADRTVATADTEMAKTLEHFTTTSAIFFGTVPDPDPPPPIGSRKELTQTNWPMGDVRSVEKGQEYSTASFLAPPQNAEPARQLRTKAQLTATNWKVGDVNTQTWSCTNTLPE